MKHQPTKVSVCLPTYQRARYLPQTIEMILNQSLRDFELIICDDASMDDTPEVVARFTDARLRYCRNEYNLGIPCILNLCLELAKGEYVIILHDHDVYAPTLLEEMVQLLDEHPEVGYVHPGVFDADERGQMVRSYVTALPRVMPGRDVAKYILRQWDCPVTALSMVRRSCLEQVGRYDQRFGFVSDVDLWIRLALKFDVGYLDKPLVGVRPREKNHPFAGANWQIAQWLSTIHEENVRRLYGIEPIRLAVALFLLGVRRRWLLLITLFHSYYRGQDHAELKGAEVLANDSSGALRLLGRLLSCLPLARNSIEFAVRFARRIREIRP